MRNRLRITHHSGFRYASEVSASFNEVRMTPLDGGGQVLIHHELVVSPSAGLDSYTDYWGAAVETFNVHVPHTKLEVLSISTVETSPRIEPGPGISWSAMRDPAARDRWCEFLVPSEYVDDAVADAARAGIVEDLSIEATPRAAARLVIEAVRDRMTYKSGSTTVATTAAEAWQHGYGVCQDFTHTSLSLLRGLGIPARYVSGYLNAENAVPGETVHGESHAWVEFWDGEWIAVDPTNDRPVGEAHVIVARGRDYADVPPIKGIYAGGRSEDLGVNVEILQLVS